MPSKNEKFYVSVLAMIGAGASMLAVWSLWKSFRRKQEKSKTYIKSKAVHVIDTPQQWDALYPQLVEQLSRQKVLGLDCEWVLKKKVALLQLATTQGLCVLVRLFKFDPVMPQTLVSLLSDKSIIKVGVAVNEDGKKLLQDYGLRVCGCVDLRHMLKRVRGVYTCTSKGLKGLAKGILDLDISKDPHVRCGNWEAEEYSELQRDYAATDAAVAVDIFLQLVYTKLQMTEAASLEGQSGKTESKNKLDESVVSIVIPKEVSDSLLESGMDKRITADESETDSGLRPHTGVEDSQNSIADDLTATSLQNDKLYVINRNSSAENADMEGEMSAAHLDMLWKTGRSMCQGLVDVPFISNTKGGGLPVSKPKGNQKAGPVPAYSMRRRPLWDNCRLLAPDDTPLCTCDVKKAQWYLDKELGDKICDDPLTVRLRFEPANRPDTERNYYLQVKENLCVVCGHDQDYVRKFIIPYEYRKYFPNALKDHSSHDVLLLCTPCHRRSCDFDSALRLQLAQECQAPVEAGATAKTVLDHDLQKIRSAGRALMLNKSSIPEARVTELEKVLKDFYGVESVPEELIKQASDIDARQIAEGYIPHGKLVVRHMARNGGLLAFQARWRQHFIDMMNPQYLPAFWSVDFVPDGWGQRQSLS
ncbi:exonuclease 3'-5' domain-containing protein 2 [Aplysia californica]|uniref:Exonuclease 3'-5' domain-containing protein 2 n=1 Tax=Aplysia californica TaxID=6500 RepID=A0ABM0JBM6_APLCA|nr:exonuclease 3'-5' domain-containing protein 2 [Aplysia californica]XP_005089946.1 exonuclease 3'-5' domain-containing protein 2 [Aplysia californica]XP_005089947.1 exonuclease 3'-5' domain-containing protein 2 [Aplysia californica]